MRKILLIGYPGSQHIVPASAYLASKYLPGFQITYTNYTGDINGWADYLVTYLSVISDERIIVALDDYLVAGPINMEKYRLAEDYLNSPEIACVKLCQCTLQEHKEYPCTTQYTLWRRTDLIEILKQVKDPWQFETEGSKLLKKGSLLEPCIFYDVHSALSNRWKGINLKGLKQSDIDDMVTKSLLPKQEPTNEDKTEINEKVVVFGGSGSLGKALIARLISMGHKNILSVSRNEASLVALKEQFPEIQIMVGDISDAWTVKSAITGATAVFLLSAMKHVGLAEQNTNACVLTNIIGVMNVVNESTHSKPAVLMFISSDKAAQGSGVYGCSKKIGERLFAEAERMNPDTKYRVVRYGNVWGSAGSIITKWRPKLEKGEEVILTDPEASRFFWTMDEAVDLIFECIQKAKDSSPYIPKMKAVKMGTVLEACMDVYGKSPVKVIGLQPGENKVETTDGVTFSDQCEQFTKEEFIERFLDHKIVSAQKATDMFFGNSLIKRHPKISAIIITKEEVYPEIIMERLNSSDFFDEILVVNHSACVYNRYLAAKEAKNRLIYFQDDDCLVNYQVLFKHYNGQITCAMPKEFINKYKDTGVCLVGWGCFFDKKMLDVFDKYTAKYGSTTSDKADKHLLREADRIFTFMNQPHNIVEMPHEDLVTAQNSDRMGYEQNHYESMREALEKCKNL